MQVTNVTAIHYTDCIPKSLVLVTFECLHSVTFLHLLFNNLVWALSLYFLSASYIFAGLVDQGANVKGYPVCITEILRDKKTIFGILKLTMDWPFIFTGNIVSAATFLLLVTIYVHLSIEFSLSIYSYVICKHDIPILGEIMYPFR